MSGWKPQYRRWKGQSTGVWARRRAIARYGLRLCLKGKIIRFFLAISLLQAVLMSIGFFAYGQFLTPDSIALSWIERVGGDRVAMIVEGLGAIALLYPDIGVDGIYRVVFFFAKFIAIPLSLITTALFIHRLIALDLASQAIVIYNSKPLTRLDYIAGKFAIAATILSVVWIAPIAISWVAGNVLAPDLSFFVHTFPSLLRGLATGIAATTTLSLLALAISSLSRKTSTAVAHWILGWVTLGFLSSIFEADAPILGYINPIVAIDALSSGLFRLDSLIADAQSQVPFINNASKKYLSTNLSDIPAPAGEIVAPILFLAAFGALSLFVVNRRIAKS